METRLPGHYEWRLGRNSGHSISRARPIHALDDVLHSSIYARRSLHGRTGAASGHEPFHRRDTRRVRKDRFGERLLREPELVNQHAFERAAQIGRGIKVPALIKPLGPQARPIGYHPKFGSWL